MSKKNILFLGFAISEDEFEKNLKYDKFPSIQTYKFTKKFIKALSLSYNIKCISSIPSSDYPYNSKIFFNLNRYSINIGSEKIDITEIPFINYGLLKIITRFFSSFIFLFFNLLKTINNKNKIDFIYVYSVHLPYMISALLLGKIFKVPIIAIWTDPPAVQNKIDGFIKSRLRNIELIISKKIMNCFKKVIVLTKYLAIDFTKDAKYLVIESIYDEEIDGKIYYTNSNLIKEKTITKIAYFGSVNKIYGLDKLVQAFTLVDDNIELHIYGTGDYSKELSQLVLKNNIFYHGLIDSKMVKEEIRMYDFLINVRSPKEEYVKYSFPSKIVEYMSSGIPFISTILPGMPNEYYEHILPVYDNSPSTLALHINKFSKMKNDERQKIGESAFRFIMKKDIKYTAIKIKKFVDSIDD